MLQDETSSSSSIFITISNMFILFYDIKWKQNISVTTKNLKIRLFYPHSQTFLKVIVNCKETQGQ